ncbi:MAG: hypothetical protein ACTSSN_05280 [Candidatus Heimdallarchaeaceae archaeon]
MKAYQKTKRTHKTSKIEYWSLGGHFFSTLSNRLTTDSSIRR